MLRLLLGVLPGLLLLGGYLLFTGEEGKIRAAVSAAWGPEVQVSNTSGDSGGSVGRTLAVDSQNRLHMVWIEHDGYSHKVYYVRSTNGGTSWTAPKDISLNTLPALGPNIAVGPDDTVHVAWIDRRNGEYYRIYYSRSFNSGDDWEPPRDISGAYNVSAQPPSITVDSRNRVHLAWHYGDPEQTEPAAQVYYVRSEQDGGDNFPAPRRLSSETGFHAAWPRFSVEGTTGDLVAIAWRDNRRSLDWDIYLAVSTDGGDNFVERVGSDTSAREWDPDTFVDSSGAIHLSYMVYRQSGLSIDYRRSTDQGQIWTAGDTLSEARSRFPFWAYNAGRGLLWLFWKDERDADPPPGENARADIAGKYSLDLGQTWSSLEFATDLGDIEVRFPSLAVGPDGSTYATWSDLRSGGDKATVFFKGRAVVALTPTPSPTATSSVTATSSATPTPTATATATAPVVPNPLGEHVYLPVVIR